MVHSSEICWSLVCCNLRGTQGWLYQAAEDLFTVRSSNGNEKAAITALLSHHLFFKYLNGLCRRNPTFDSPKVGKSLLFAIPNILVVMAKV